MINIWHSWLGMPKFDKEWHQQDLADEVAEYHEETKIFKKWSELSDVVYTCTRSKWSGYDVPFPFSRLQFYVGVTYMIPKYSSRWLFFRAAGRKSGARKTVREVRNPRKTAKLHSIAERNHLDKDKFQKVCARQLRYWPLLP